MADLRKAPRIEPLVIRTRILHEGNAQNGYLANLSEGGAFLVSDRPLAVGDIVQIKASLPWALGRLVARAKVAWRTEDIPSRAPDLPGGVGLSFIDLSDEVREKIRLYTQRFFQLAAQLENT